MNYYNLELIFLDYVILILTFLFFIFSFWKGFINSVLGLMTWVGSIFITIYLYTYLSNFLYNLLLNIELFSEFQQFVSILSIIISIPIIFIISLFILKRIRKLLSSDLDRQVLGIILDKFFGAIYGLLFSYIFFSTLLYLTLNNNFDILINFNNFLIKNSNILNQISEYNDNIIKIYSKDLEN